MADDNKTVLKETASIEVQRSADHSNANSITTTTTTTTTIINNSHNHNNNVSNFEDQNHHHHQQQQQQEQLHQQQHQLQQHQAAGSSPQNLQIQFTTQSEGNANVIIHSEIIPMSSIIPVTNQRVGTQQRRILTTAGTLR